MKSKTNTLTLLFFVLISMTSCTQKQMDTESWEQKLNAQIKHLGHRNWIVVADAAYPLQSNAGITTILSDDGHLNTIAEVKKIINEQSHIKPNVYLDQEIDFVDNADAPGMNDFRNSIDLLLGSDAHKMIHEDIIHKLDQASELFNVIIIKTDFTIPYTTVFFELDCKYWNAEAETRLRQVIIDNQ